MTPDISIHAPLAGCDRTQKTTRPAGANFNPRTPCGVRPGALSLSHLSSEFQSTHPLRGATLVGLPPGNVTGISIHAPLAGCDRGKRFGVVLGEISIHAPLAGCDDLIRPVLDTSKHFNPRTPCGVRLFDTCFWIGRFWISIHAPLAGCDSQTESDWLCC